MWTALVFSQTITIKGSIHDSHSGKPVSFASIAIVELEKGTTSLENGEFELTLDNQEITNKLSFSCINYESKVIPLSSLSLDKINQIDLIPIVYNISEVIIKPKNDHKEIVINKLKKSKIHGGLSCGNLPKMYARYFSYNSMDESINTISSIQIYCQPWNQKSESKVRIRFFQMDTVLKLPSSDILHKEIITSLKKGAINNIKMLENSIKIPKEGIFVAVEWLIIPDNAYRWTTYDQTKNKQSRIDYGPVLGANYCDESNTWLFWAGKWQKFILPVPAIPKIKKNQVFDASISITLTN